MIVTITANTASEYAASRSAVVFSSAIALRGVRHSLRGSLACRVRLQGCWAAIKTVRQSPGPKEAMMDLHRSMHRGDVTVSTPTFSVEVITLPVSDVERALRFYVDQ